MGFQMDLYKEEKKFIKNIPSIGNKTISWNKLMKKWKRKDMQVPLKNLPSNILYKKRKDMQVPSKNLPSNILYNLPSL